MSQVFSTPERENKPDCTLVEQVTYIGNALRERGWQVSCAESCTGGGLAYYFTSVSGSSDWFSQSWVTYSNDAKMSALGVPESVLAEYGAVSEQTVAAMVNGVHQQSGAELGVSISGIAGPGGGSVDKPVGTVWFGFYFNGEVITRRCVFDGDRDAVRLQAIAFALDNLYQWLVAQ